MPTVARWPPRTAPLPAHRLKHPLLRPWTALALLTLWALSQVVLPGWHLLFHEEAHRQAAALCAQTLDVAPLTDPATGRVDLTLLAHALECGGSDHTHDPELPLDDVEGVALHYGVLTPGASTRPSTAFSAATRPRSPRPNAGDLNCSEATRAAPSAITATTD